MINDDALLGVFSQVPRPAAPPEPGPRPSAAPGQEPALLYRLPKERRTRHFGRSEVEQHPWERAAEELYRWERETPEILAAALMPSGRPPFTTAASLVEQRDYWLSQLRLPDGTINMPALDALLAAASPAEVHALAESIRKLENEEHEQNEVTERRGVPGEY